MKWLISIASIFEHDKDFSCICLILIVHVFAFGLKKTTLVSDEVLVHANNMMHVT